ncbi:MAG: cytochrome c [Solirubrobacterales bacterium]|nr:cytochrome c [Solirubrobacterales bacterium]
MVSTCGACHTLSDAGTNGQIGPDLDDVAPDVEEVLTAIETGPAQMPENLLEGEEARQVAEPSPW